MGKALSISAGRRGRARLFLFTSEGGMDWSKNMDLRLELRRTNKLVVASPEGDSAFRWYPFPALPCRALDSFVPSGLVSS
jgi:hypothetical protein